MTTIRITDLKLKTIIGINGWERTTKQIIIINITLKYDAQKAIHTDNIHDAIDYKTLTKHIIKEVTRSKFFLLEKLTHAVLAIVMSSPKVKSAAVRIDKPKALRFAKSVSCELSAQRQ